MRLPSAGAVACISCPVCGCLKRNGRPGAQSSGIVIAVSLVPGGGGNSGPRRFRLSNRLPAGASDDWSSFRLQQEHHRQQNVASTRTVTATKTVLTWWQLPSNWKPYWAHFKSMARCKMEWSLLSAAGLLPFTGSLSSELCCLGAELDAAGLLLFADSLSSELCCLGVELDAATPRRAAPRPLQEAGPPRGHSQTFECSSQEV